jgi:hypothetical protein
LRQEVFGKPQILPYFLKGEWKKLPRNMPKSRQKKGTPIERLQDKP